MNVELLEKEDCGLAAQLCKRDGL